MASYKIRLHTRKSKPLNVLGMMGKSTNISLSTYSSTLHVDYATQTLHCVRYQYYNMDMGAFTVYFGLETWKVIVN